MSIKRKKGKEIAFVLRRTQTVMRFQYIGNISQKDVIIPQTSGR